MLVNPILRARHPLQLAILEDQSPHLRPDTQDIPARHVSERFKGDFEIENDADWRDMSELTEDG